MIEEYGFGFIKIDGKGYTNDVIVFQGKVSSWWRVTGHKVAIADIEEFIGEKPEVIIFGQGDPGFMKVSLEVKTFLSKKEIEIIELPTKEAVKQFNELIKTRNVAGAFHLTC